MLNNPVRFCAFPPPVLALMALSLVTTGNGMDPDAEFMAISKTQYFQQFSPNIVALLDEDSGEAPLDFEAVAIASDPNLLTSGFLRRPTGPDVLLALEGGGEELRYQEGFATPSEMNTAFADGPYTLNIVGVNDGPKMIDLNFSGDTYPGLTRFTMFESAQSINASGAMIFQWNTIPTGVVGDLVSFSIENESGENIFETPDTGESGGLDWTSNSVSVPGGRLDPGTEYSAYLDVYRSVDSNEDYAPGVTALSAYGKSVRMQIRTTGPVPATIPTLLHSIPGDSWQGVALNTIITFVFDEAMDTTVPVGAINWTGVTNAALFAYRWSPDATTLFCNYAPGLPTSATIGWTLNPAGSTAKLRNAAGNDLPDDLPGSFTTSDTSNLGVSDVDFVGLIKAKMFDQSGSTPVDTGSYIVDFFVELNGISTVSSVDFDIPGGTTETDLGEFEDDHVEIWGNVFYAEQADMDTIFPNGNYEITLHTFHDGDQSLTLNLGPDSYPNAPTIQNFATTQAVDSSQAFTLDWGAMDDGTTGDFIALDVEGETACFFNSPDVGAPDALDGTAISLTLPADTLPPGRTLRAELAFVKIIDNDTSQYRGALGITAFVTFTQFTIQTTGTPFVPRLELTHDGTQAQVMVTAERGRAYEISTSENLDDWTPVWTEWLPDDCNGYQGTFDYFDDVVGIPTRYYQVRELPLDP